MKVIDNLDVDSDDRTKLIANFVVQDSKVSSTVIFYKNLTDRELRKLSRELRDLKDTVDDLLEQ